MTIKGENENMADKTEEEYRNHLNEVAYEGYMDGLDNRDAVKCPYEKGTREYDIYMDGVNGAIHEWKKAQGEWEPKENVLSIPPTMIDAAEKANEIFKEGFSEFLLDGWNVSFTQSKREGCDIPFVDHITLTHGEDEYGIPVKTTTCGWREIEIQAPDKDHSIIVSLNKDTEIMRDFMLSDERPLVFRLVEHVVNEKKQENKQV